MRTSLGFGNSLPLFYQQSFNSGGEALLVDEVFKSGSYIGDGVSETITTPSDCSGGFVLQIANKSTGAVRCVAFDGTNVYYFSFNSTGAITNGNSIFTITDTTIEWTTIEVTNGVEFTYALWKVHPRVCNVVVRTGTGSAHTRAHGIDAELGMMIIKGSSTVSFPVAWHRDVTNPAQNYAFTNTGTGWTGNTTIWNNTAPTSSDYSIGTDAAVNGSGVTFVDILFAHDEAADGVIRCDQRVAGSSPVSVTEAGWQPQWMMHNAFSGTGHWVSASEVDSPGWTGTDPFKRWQQFSTGWETAQDNVTLITGGYQINGTNTHWNEAGRTYVTLIVRRPA